MKRAFEIIFNDEYIVVLNKIAKILIQPSAQKEKHTLTSLLKKSIGEEVYPCHRLDRETTGLIIYAKDRKTQGIITAQFKKQEIKKKYFALIRGTLKKKKGVFKSVIIDREGRIFGEKAKKAVTHYRVLREFPGGSAVELAPLTGRTNQLRIQLADAGCPVLGERKYAFGRDFPVKFRRLALHAFFLSFIHPVSRERIDFRINLPPEMEEVIAQRGSFCYNFGNCK